MSEVSSSKIPDQGSPDRNPAITVYSGVVRVLAGFWSGYVFYSVHIYARRKLRLFCSQPGYWSSAKVHWQYKAVSIAIEMSQFISGNI